MRDVLVALCGLTPQVVTETLWALHHRTPPIDPAEVWILTTRQGAKSCRVKLLGNNGALARFVRDYKPAPIPRCGVKQVIVLKGADNQPLDDVRSERDSRALADQFAEFIGQQTDRQDVRLHCSVAGGRKTMVVLLAIALQIYGRPEDRLYHVLVPPEFESLNSFFYPPPRPTRLTGRSGRRLYTARCRIELGEVPYVRLRGLLSPTQLRQDAGFSSLVETAERRLRTLRDPEPILLGQQGSRLCVGDRVIALRPAMMTLYRALTQTKLAHCEQPELPTCGDCTECYMPFTKDTWEASKRLLEQRGGGLLLPKARGPEDAPEQFRSLVSKLNKMLDQAIETESGENPYRIRSAGTKGHTAYGLALDKTKMSIG